MKIIATVIALSFCWTTNLAQIALLEKQALATVQRMSTSTLNKELPNVPFDAWFLNLVGPKAGVIWQLTPCGEIAKDGKDDQLACVEANAVLPDTRKVIILINVGTFKNGINPNPVFYNGVIDNDGQLFKVRYLSDLQKMIQNPDILTVELPDISADTPKLTANLSDTPPTDVNLVRAPLPEPSAENLLPAPPALAETNTVSSPQTPQKIESGIIQSRAIFKVKPLYPGIARTRNITGSVLVEIVIGEDGRVRSAKSVNGHPALRATAEEAALKWVFTPTKLNGQSIKVESSLTFNFSPNE